MKDQLRMMTTMPRLRGPSTSIRSKMLLVHSSAPRAYNFSDTFQHFNLKEMTVRIFLSICSCAALPESPPGVRRVSYLIRFRKVNISTSLRSPFATLFSINQPKDETT